MSVFAGPEIDNSGLALALDALNTKSYPGIVRNIAPFNNYSNRSYGVLIDIGGWNGDDADVTYYASGGYNNLPYKKMTKHTGGTGGSYIDEHSTFTIANNRNYKISCWMKASTAVTVNQLSLCINRSSDNTYFSRGTDIALTTEWTKIEWYWNSGSNASSTYLGRHIVYNDVGLPIDVFWCDFRVEPIDENIYDLTGKNSLGEYTLTYSNTNPGILSFNGTDNFISGNLTPLAVNSSSTIEAVVRLSDVTGLRAIFSHGRSGVAFNSGLVTVDGQIRFRNSNNDWAFSSPTTLSPNVWYHLVVSSDSNGTTGYCNGISQGSNVYKLTTCALSEWTIGRRSIPNNTERLSGSLAILNVYQNRALTATEVRQNFNALRARFGI